MIPNIVYGKGISGALAYVLSEGFAEEKAEGTSNDNRQQGRYKTLGEDGHSRVTILGGQNFGFDIDTPERLELARRVMEWQGLPENQGSKTRKQELDCLHASLSWNPGETPDRDEMLQAGAEFLKSIGLEKARAVFIAHDDTDHAHIHIVASRIDPETGKTLRVDYDKQKSQEWALEWEAAHGQQRQAGKGLHALREAVQGRDVDAVLSYLTRDKATFQAWEINRALQYGGLNGEARDQLRAAILGDKNTLGLRDQSDGQVMRYTTRQVLADEMAVIRSAGHLAEDQRHSLTETHTDEIGVRFTLQPEQAQALAHLTHSDGFAILWGEAGTGKSHTLNAARAAYAEAGRDVIGLSWTNDVVQQMRGDGFQKAETISSELYALENGRRAWSKNTVVIVDEAAMASTAALAKVMTAAEQAGAKLIVAGDDAQLSSIERGGMFETLRQIHGAAVLSDVQRVKLAEQQAAFNQMHKGEFAEALQTFDKAQGVHWATKQSDALKQMAERYTADLAADPSKKRFMFAYTNADVADLNAQAREMHKARGDLGRDHELATKHGVQNFATGDRIQFTANGYTQRAKRLGLVNGRVGTVEGIAYDDRYRAHVTVALDAKKGEKAKRLTFVVGENEKAGEFNAIKHGYAGTIYRGQGKTLDQTYVAYSKHMRASAAYVALTRHRQDVHIFAARETVKNLDAMAKGMSRTEGKRAATAYVLDEGSALKLDFSDMSRATTMAERVAVLSSRGYDRAQAMREAQRQQNSAEAVRSSEQNAKAEQQPDAKRTPEQQRQDATGSIRDEADAPQLADRKARKAALQELIRLFGRDVTQPEGKEISKNRDRGGGRSL